MLKSQFFVRGDLTNPNANLEDLDHFDPHRQNHFMNNDEDFFIWLLQPSVWELYSKTCMLVIAVLFVCMIKIWPLWLKIGVWWCSLICLICMLSLIVIRLFLAAIFALIGKRGIWLLPNLLNDDVDFMDAFTPLFGYGIDMKDYQQQQLKRYADGRRRRAKSSKKSASEKAAAKAEKKKAKLDAVVDSSDSFRLGLINFAVIGIIGVVLCNWLGLFMPEMLPDFVVSQVELWKEYPSLAPPDFDAEAHAAEEAEKAKRGKTGGPSLEDILADEADEENAENEEHHPDPILDRVDDETGEYDDLDLPDVPDDDEDMPDVPDDDDFPDVPETD